MKKKVKYFISILFSWTILIVILIVLEFYKIQEETYNLAKTEARSNFNKDQAIRFWADLHGGIYVPIDSITQPNPALSHIPERDIETPSGKRLTLVNPAFMMRELNEYFSEYYGVIGHLTSKKLINPENKPDKWELAALNQFEKGIKEISEYSDVNGKPFLRFMQPVITKQSCLKCHSYQGYKVGDIRGGISIAIPMEPILIRASHHVRRSLWTFGLAWLIGFTGLLFGYRRLGNSMKKQKQAEEKLIATNEELVALTVALKKSNNQLIIANEKAQKSEAKYKQLSDATFEGIILHENGIAFEINNSIQEMFGYTYEELIGQNIIQLCVAEKYHSIITQNINKKTSIPYEIEAIKKDGSVFPVELEGRNIESKDNINITRIVAVRDISIRKEAQKELNRLSTAVEQSSNSIIITDINGNIEYTNPKFTELTGYTAEEVLGQNPRIVNSGTHSKKHYSDLWQTITSEKTWKGEFHNKKKNGDYYWTQSTITPIKNETEEIINFLAINEDITARKKAEHEIHKKNQELLVSEEELRTSNKELILAKNKAEESDRLKTEFINNMSHEIRTPLNGILGFSSLLDQKNKSEVKRKQYINIINNCGDQLLRIIDGILEISILGTKQVKVVEKEICLNDLIFELFSIFNIKAKEKKIPLHLKKGLSDKESNILTDKTKLNKILSNLLENAIKYTNEGFIEFGYQLKNKELEFYVKDTGIGIKSESQKTVFDRFSQEEKGLSRKVGGLGLGLSIAKENIELLGGKITLKSKKGQGSTFFVSIPYKQVLPVAENRKLDNGKRKTTKNPDEYNVLIVEDEETNYLYLETLLDDEIDFNFKIHHAKNGQEAVEICKNNLKIDFILMDLKMPIMNGFEATTRIKEFRPDVPIVAQTAYSTKEDKEKAIDAGCNDFISKPISIDTLNKIINKYLMTK
jgi:PAS domain S-box-containing protein